MNGSLIAIIVILVLCLVLAGIIYYTYCRIREKLRDTSRMLFGTDSMIEGMKQTFDYVIIDTPPMANLIDGAIVASNCDGAIIVVEQGAVSYRLEQKVKSQLDKTGCRVLGVVLNKVDLSQNGYYGRYGKYGKYGKYGRYGKYDKYGAYSPYEKAEAAQTTDK